MRSGRITIRYVAPLAIATFRDNAVTDYEHLRPEERPYRGAEILGAIFWDIRKAIDRSEADKLLMAAWLRFTYAGSDHSARAFLAIYLSQLADEQHRNQLATVRRIFRAHGVASP